MFVVTFYSYKGGVGRTTALANVAYRLARRGKRVFILDFDLEAPGIDSYGLCGSEGPHEGLVEYISSFTKTGQVPPLRDYVLNATLPGMTDRVFVMPAGKRDNDYQSDLGRLDWKVFYKQKRGYLFVENLKAAIKDVFRPDYVLVDSRTGLTDISGICTLQLPNLVVLVFSLNEQNVNGTARIYHSIKNNKLNRNISTLLVASPVPDMPEWVAVRGERFENARKSIGATVDVVLPYDPFLAFQESILEVQEDEEVETYLAKSYDSLADKVILANSGDVLTLLREATELKDEGNFELAELHYREVVEARPESADAWIEFGKFVRLRADRAKEACEYFEKALELRPEDSEVFAQLAITYSQLDRAETHTYYKKFLSVETDTDRLDRVSKVIREAGLTELSIGGFERIIELDDEHGTAHFDLAETHMRLGHYREAASAYKKALDLEPTSLSSTYNTGYALYCAGDASAVDLFHKAVELWEQLDRSAVTNVLLTNYAAAISNAYLAIGQPEKAVAALESAISMSQSLGRTRIFSSRRYVNVPQKEFVAEVMDMLATARKRVEESRRGRQLPDIEGEGKFDKNKEGRTPKI